MARVDVAQLHDEPQNHNKNFLACAFGRPRPPENVDVSPPFFIV